MEDKPLKKGFLQSLFGFGKAGLEPTQKLAKNEVPEVQSQPTANSVSGASVPARVQTEAYQNRKKGRKNHADSLEDIEKIVAYIQNHGEVTPGELAQELGMSRSTLTYNLKKLLDQSDGKHGNRKYVGTTLHYFFKHLLGQKRIERLGAGQTVRYRIVDIPQTGSSVEPTTPQEG